MTHISLSNHATSVASNSRLRVLKTPYANTARQRRMAPSTRTGTRFINRSTANGRRRGQALLISVLLMIFAAILGATFVTVVALNLGQTARSSSVNTARQAANSGLQFVNDQLTNSREGENWRPQLEASQPASAGDTYYYTDFERAQGWDQPEGTSEVVGAYPTPTSTMTTNPQFVKFPDPRSTSITGNNTPTYLTKVERVTSGDRTGQLKVTVIGRASDDDAASYTLTFYKPTTQSGNVTSFARYDSNWNFGTNNLIKTATVAGSTSNVVMVANSSGFTVGRTILIGAADVPASVRTAVIQAINGNQLTINPADGQGNITAAAGVPVRAVSSFMGTLSNLDALGTASGTTEATKTPLQTASGGVMVNNGVFFDGKSQLTLNTTGTTPDRVLVSGPISIQGSAVANVTNGGAPEDIKTTTTLTPFVNYQKSEADDPTNPTSPVRALTPARIDDPNSRWLQLTKLTGDTGAQYGYGSGVYIDNRDDVEKVGVVKNVNVYGQTSFRPLTISETQRLLQRKSFPIVPQLPAGSSEYGNADVDPANFSRSTSDPTKGEYAAPSATSTSIAHRLIYPRFVPPPLVSAATQPYSFPLNSSPSPTPAPTLLQDPSLEERGLRGWVSPTEFLPRGTLVELRGNQIIITRDDLSDQSRWLRNGAGDVTYSNGTVITDASVAPAATNSLQPNPKYNLPDYDKAWKDPSGNPTLPIVPSSTNTNGFRMVLNLTTGQRSFGASGHEVNVGTATPFNGVIYADGNVRVRGFTNASTPDLTIASMGNIYVEGGINQQNSSTGRVALLAKKSVILNPTQVLARVEGAQSAAIVANVRVDGASTATAATPVTLTQVQTTTFPDDFNKLRVGDKFRFGNDSVWHMVTQLDNTTTPSTISFTPSYTTSAPLVSAPMRLLTYNDGSQVQSWVAQPGRSDIVTRDVKFDGATLSGNYDFDMLHYGFPVYSVFNRQAGSTSPGQLMVAAVGNTKTLTLVPNSVPPLITTDLIGGIPAAGNAAAGTLGALVWQTYLDDGGVAPQPGPPAIPGFGTANNGDRDALLKPFMNSVPVTQNAFVYGEADANPDWDLFVPAAIRNLQARRLANTTPLGTSRTVTPLTSTSSGDPLVPPSVQALSQDNSTSGGIPLCVSVGLYQTDPFLGFASTPVSTIGSSFTLPNNEQYTETTADTFYQNTNVRSAVFFGSNLTLTSSGNNSNVAAFRRDLAPDNGLDVLPAYFLQSYKLDRADLATVEADPININVQATIYAQDGSWFVIPTPAYQVLDATSIDEATSHRRLNYKFIVQASIAENFAPPATSDYDAEQTPDQSMLTAAMAQNVGPGVQGAWLDAAAYPFNGPSNAVTWQTINYKAPVPLPAGNTLYLPMTPDISIQR